MHLHKFFDEMIDLENIPELLESTDGKTDSGEEDDPILNNLSSSQSDVEVGIYVIFIRCEVKTTCHSLFYFQYKEERYPKRLFNKKCRLSWWKLEDVNHNLICSAMSRHSFSTIMNLHCLLRSVA